MMVARIGPLRVPPTAVALVLAILGAGASLGCASDAGPWATRALAAGPGETLLEEPEAVRSELSCDTAEALPRVAVESDGIEPPAAAPGGLLTHRIVYAFCPRRGSRTLRAQFRRVFVRDGLTIHTAVDDGFAFKPGRWSVEREIHVPDAARPGEYTVQVELRGDDFEYRNTLRFRIDPGS